MLQFEATINFVLEINMWSISLFLIITMNAATFYPQISSLPFERPIISCTEAKKKICQKFGNYELCINRPIYCTKGPKPDPKLW